MHACRDRSLPASVSFILFREGPKLGSARVSFVYPWKCFHRPLSNLMDLNGSIHQGEADESTPLSFNDSVVDFQCEPDRAPLHRKCSFGSLRSATPCASAEFDQLVLENGCLGLRQCRAYYVPSQGTAFVSHSEKSFALGYSPSEPVS